MSINYENFSRLLPFKDQPPGKRQRDSVWQSWDMNGNGFISLKEIEDGFIDLFELEDKQEIKRIIRVCADETKKRFSIDGHFGPNYMEKREFRVFLEALHRHIRSYIVYHLVVKDNEITYQKLEDATDKLINKKKFTPEEKERALKLTKEKQFSYFQFESWMTSLNYYLSLHLK